jgi:aspartate carbamoyltransferase regulatory subunit
MEFVTDNFKIEFLEEKKFGVYYLYKIKVTCLKNSKFIPSQIYSTIGVNITSQGTELSGNLYIKDKIMKKNDIIEGYICYMMYSATTNNADIHFMYEKLNVKKPQKIKKVGDINEHNTNLQSKSGSTKILRYKDSRSWDR